MCTHTLSVAGSPLSLGHYLIILPSSLLPERQAQTDVDRHKHALATVIRALQAAEDGRTTVDALRALQPHLQALAAQVAGLLLPPSSSAVHGCPQPTTAQLSAPGHSAAAQAKGGWVHAGQPCTTHSSSSPTHDCSSARWDQGRQVKPSPAHSAQASCGSPEATAQYDNDTCRWDLQHF